MKAWIFLIIVCAVGFVVHQIYTGSTQDTPPADPIAYEELPPLPQKCEEQSDTLEDAISDHELGKLTDIELKEHISRFKSCLRDAGFTDSQINRTYGEIKEGTMNEADSPGGSDDENN